MTHSFSGLRVRTLTINSGDVPPSNMFGHVSPHLSIKPWLDMTSFGNLLLLFIAMTHAGCGLRQCTVSKNSDDISPRACLGRTPPFKHVRARTPLSIKPFQDMTSVGNLLLLFLAMTHAWAMKCMHITCNVHIVLCFALRFY